MTSTFARNFSLLFLIALPVAFLPLSAVGYDTVKAAILAGFVVVASVVALFRKLGEPGKEITVTLVCLLAAVASLSTVLAAVLSPTPLLSWYGDGVASAPALVSLALVGVFLLFKASSTSAELASRSVLVFLAAWSVVLAWEVIRYILIIAGVTVPSVGFFFGPAINTIGRITDLSLFLALGVAILVALDRVISVQGKRSVGIYIATALAGILMFFIKFSLSWYLLAAVGLCVICHALVFDKERRVPAFPLVVVLVSFAMILGGSVLINGIYTISGSAEVVSHIDPYAGVVEDIRPNFAATMTVAEFTLKKSPVLGAGPARFSREIHASGVLGGLYYGNTPVWNNDFFTGHSMMATRLVSEGILGFLAWAALVIMVMFYSLRLALVAHRDATKKTVSVVLAVITVFATGTFFWYPPSIVVTAILFALLGVAAGFVASEQAMPARSYSIANNKRVGFTHALGLVFGLLIILSFGFAWMKGLAATYFYNSALVAAQESRGDDAVNQLAKSAYFVPGSIAFRSVADIQRLMALEIVNSEDAEAQAQKAAQLAVDSVENARRAVAADPNNYANYVALARALTLGMPQTSQAASAAYEAAKPLAPRNPTVLIEQAIVEAISGNKENALMLVEGVLKINPNIVDAQQLRDAINSAEFGDVEAAAASAVQDADETQDSETDTTE